MKYALWSGPAATSLCEALGLNPKQTVSVHITLGPGQLANMRAETYLSEETVDAVAKRLVDMPRAPDGTWAA